MKVMECAVRDVIYGTNQADDRIDRPEHRCFCSVVRSLAKSGDGGSVQNFY